MSKSNCDSTIYNEGTHIFAVGSISTKRMEKQVKAIEKASKQPVDWSFFGGRAIVITTGSIPIVKQQIEKALPQLEKQIFKTCKENGYPELCKDPSSDHCWL